MSGILSNAENLIIFVIMLGVLVFVHESGHFVVAKRLGVPVLEFGFGFPPRLLKFWQSNGSIQIQGRRIVIPRRFKLPDNLTVGSRVTYKTATEKGREILTGVDVVDAESQGLALASPVQALDRGTEYTINMIPLGGFVRLMGEEDPNVPGGFATAKPSVRARVLIAGVTMNLLLAYLVYVFTTAVTPPYVTVQTTRISGVAQDSPAALAGLRIGDDVVAVNGQNVDGDYVALSHALTSNAGHPVTLIVQRGAKTLDPIQATPRLNPPPGQGALGIALNGWTGIQVIGVAPGSVADQAGVRSGDVLVFLVDPKGRTLKDQNELMQFTQSNPGLKIQWQLMRGGKLLAPITVQIPNPVNPQAVALGLNLQLPLYMAPVAGGQRIVAVFAAVPDMIRQMVRGAAPPVGFIGIYQATGEVAQRFGPIALLEFLALLSLNLAIVNIFPFPALDGGRLVFVLLEWVRGGKKIDARKEGLVHLVGIAVLLGLMIIISFFDLQRLVSGQSIIP